MKQPTITSGLYRRSGIGAVYFIVLKQPTLSPCPEGYLCAKGKPKAQFNSIVAIITFLTYLVNIFFHPPWLPGLLYLLYNGTDLRIQSSKVYVERSYLSSSVPTEESIGVSRGNPSRIPAYNLQTISHNIPTATQFSQTSPPFFPGATRSDSNLSAVR